MAEFLRPEAAAALRRWREVIAALALVALGVWIAARPGMIVQGFGWVLAAAGAVALVPAVRRARFAISGDGPGVVQVVERRILYMGPVEGGAVALDELQRLSIRREADGRATWILAEPGAMLTIPVDARGADALFDAFTALPGLSPERVLAAARGRTPGTQALWSRAGRPALTR